MDATERSMVPWILLIVASLLAVVAAFGVGAGSCPALAGGGEEDCVTGPSIGWAGAWVIAAIAFAASAYATWRIVRLDLARRGRRDAGR